MILAITFEQTIATTIEGIQRDLGLTSAELAGGLNVTTRTLERWRKGESLPQREARERLAQLAAVRDHALETFYAEDVPGWMHDRNRYLAGMTPAEAISAGRIDRAEGALGVIDYGIYV